jgi:hypothetical protein
VEPLGDVLAPAARAIYDRVQAPLAICGQSVQAALREKHDDECREHENSRLAWEKARDAASKAAKGDRARIKTALDALAPAPLPPLEPLLNCPEPTYEVCASSSPPAGRAFTSVDLGVGIGFSAFAHVMRQFTS